MTFTSPWEWPEGVWGTLLVVITVVIFVAAVISAFRASDD